MIYLDHHAATPLCPAARQAMTEACGKEFGNPASVHAAGRGARRVIERARTALAQAIAARPADVILTSGGTESCNLIVRGLCAAPRHVVTTEIEHPALREAVALLERGGARVTRLAVPEAAVPGADALAEALRADTDLVAVQWVNHEVGVRLPVEDYAALCAQRGIMLVIDACQALGKLPIEVERLPAAALAFAASKVGGPAGAGAVWAARCQQLEPLLVGGGQERGRRPGTPDVIACAGFAAALEQLPARLAAAAAVEARRDRLEQALITLGARVNGRAAPRVHSVTNVSVPGWRGDLLVAALDLEGLCASSGAACSSGLGAPSEVLRAMYPREPERAESALRLSLGPETSDAEIEEASAVLRRVIGRVPHAERATTG